LVEACPDSLSPLTQPCATAEESVPLWKELAELLEPSHVDVGFNYALALERFDAYCERHTDRPTAVVTACLLLFLPLLLMSMMMSVAYHFAPPLYLLRPRPRPPHTRPCGVRAACRVPCGVGALSLHCTPAPQTTPPRCGRR
jgi:hypothetical protein